MVLVCWLPDSGGCFWAETASKARYQCYQKAREVCFYPEFSEIRIRRAPQYDTIPDVDTEDLKFWTGIGLYDLQDYIMQETVQEETT